MVSKNITITKEAYNYLKQLKTANKSFSEVILSLKAKKDDLISFAGSLKDADLSSIENVRIQNRKDWNRK